MKLIKGILAISCLFFSLTVTGQAALIDYNESWSYYDNPNQPPNQSTLDWNDTSYDDASWSSGIAELGYGDSDEVTVINDQTQAAYFRHTFNVSDPSLFDAIDLELIYDDGAIVYLNGVEIWRVNMPSGAVDYNTNASSVVTENAFDFTSLTNTLVTGTNVLAVEIHQISTGSSDISFDFKLIGSIPGAVDVERGPYLQKGSSSSVTIQWRTDEPTESIIEYGTALANLNLTYSNTTLKTEHIAELNGLSANTKYYYKVKNSAGDIVPSLADLHFQTHPTIGTEQPIRMWILGDPGTANNDQRAVRDAYYNYVGNDHTDGILFLGDNAYGDGTDIQYQNAMFSNMYEEKMKNTIAWSCLGNHDGHSTDSNSQTGPYYDIFSFPTAGESGGVASGTEAYYSFDYGNIHFIALESYQTDRSVGGAMYNWAQADIQATTQEWIVAYWHHPPYTKGSHDSDLESNLIDMRQNFLPMLEENGVDLILSGHSHSYERSYLIKDHFGDANTFDMATNTVGATGGGDGKSDGDGAYAKTINGPDAGDGAVYITTGSAGKISNAPLDHQAMFYSVAQLGSCVLEVNGDTLDVKFVRETGAIDDYFTIVKETDDCIAGSACDDNNLCTINDSYDTDCNCLGTSLPDSDNDGVCDAEDLCPSFDDNLIGTSCDDGDPLTENDVYTENCACEGTIDPCSTAGELKYEVYSNITGTAVSNLTSSSNYPLNPTTTTTLTSLFEGNTPSADDYGSRITGVLCPPQTGNYTFWISGDDNCELWLSTDNSPDNVSLIANIPGWTGKRVWNKYTEQESASIYLEAGQNYYIMALHKEGSGGDHMAVGWRLPDNTLERPISTSYFDLPTTNNCPLAGTDCDDGNINTLNDIEDGNCLCQGTPINTTLNTCYAITDGKNDAEQNGSDNSMYLTSTDIELVNDGNLGDQTIGLRFTDIQVPAGAIITEAYIQFTTDETNSKATSLTISAQDIGNAEIFEDIANNISTRSKTASELNVTWSPPSWNTEGESGPDQRTPDLGNIIQHIVERPDYNKGNAIAILINGTGERTAESYEGSPTDAPTLCIEYKLCHKDLVLDMSSGALSGTYEATNSITLSGPISIQPNSLINFKAPNIIVQNNVDIANENIHIVPVGCEN